MAHVLRDTGLRKGDHMAIFMENHPAVLLAEAGAERTGLYFTPVNFYLSAEEVAYVINDSLIPSRRDVDGQGGRGSEELPALCPDVERWISWSTRASSGDSALVGAPFASWGTTPSGRNPRVTWRQKRWAPP